MAMRVTTMPGMETAIRTKSGRTSREGPCTRRIRPTGDATGSTVALPWEASCRAAGMFVAVLASNTARLRGASSSLWWATFCKVDEGLSRRETIARGPYPRRMSGRTFHSHVTRGDSDVGSSGHTRT